jgi:hypothetical protein
MLVRLVEEHRRGADRLAVGSLLDLPDDEAMVLVQDGIAVPASRERLATEIR